MSDYTPMTNPLSSPTSPNTFTSPNHSESSPFVPPQSTIGISSPLSHSTNYADADTIVPNDQGQGSSHPTTTSTSFSVIRTPGGGVNGRYEDWEEEYERQKMRAWEEKVGKDLEGWRGGNGTPRSSYPRGALPPNSYYHQPVTGTVGQHLPKEIVRVDRDWSGGEVCQFETFFPMELEGRISPKQFTSFINELNKPLISAYSIKGAIWDNTIAIATLWTSLIWRTSCFERELRRAEEIIDRANKEVFNQQGLNVLSPRDVALQFLEIEYY
nr:uncharacterized protein CI109_005567 [Kwoniella shandongensis]KAA5526133.1 hypothetical protein CI109_005567 [Kwoniella shandongensis]